MWLWISEYGCGRMWLPNVARRSQAAVHHHRSHDGTCLWQMATPVILFFGPHETVRRRTPLSRLLRKGATPDWSLSDPQLLSPGFYADWSLRHRFRVLPPSPGHGAERFWNSCHSGLVGSPNGLSHTQRERRWLGGMQYSSLSS